MYGVFIGDKAGSPIEVLEVKALRTEEKHRSYAERIKILNPQTPLFERNATITDDSCLTIATMDALLHDKSFESCYRFWGEKERRLGVDQYGRSRFGSGFISWLDGTKEGNSYGNGAPMRVAPIAFWFDDLATVLDQARLSSIPSHNHPEAIAASQAIASAIFLARTGYSKIAIKDYIETQFGYMFTQTLDDFRRENRFSSKACVTTPQALACFFQAKDFEDGIRKALSIGSDSDTIGAMTGGILEAYYGVPENFIPEVEKDLRSEQKEIVDQFYQTLQEKGKVYMK